MICSLFFLWIYTDIFFNNCPELLCLFRIFQAFNFRTGIKLQITLSARASRKKKAVGKTDGLKFLVEVLRGLTKLSDPSSSSSKTLKFRSSARPFYTEFQMLRIGIGKTKKVPFLSKGNPCQKFVLLMPFYGQKHHSPTRSR